MTILEINHSDLFSGRFNLNQCFLDGNIVVFRNFPEIYKFREELVEYARECGGSDSIEKELLEFYREKKTPSAEAIYALSLAIKKSRRDKYLSSVLSTIIQACDFKPPILVDGGINRLFFPSDDMETLKTRTDLFTKTDFLREFSYGPTETFMMGDANIHRDILRDHAFLMINFWIPLHDLPEEESLSLFPEDYHRHSIVELDNSSDNKKTLGKEVRISLKFGDFVAFHSELLHGSPVRKKSTRRHSYDFRIATDCYDDMRHYRHNFSNLHNFVHEESLSFTLQQNYTNIYNVKAHHALHKGHDNAYFYANVADYMGSDLNIDLLENINVLFDSFPFAEDRYIEVATKLGEFDTEKAVAIMKKVIDSTSSFFWLLTCGNLCMKLGASSCAKEAFNKSIDMARITKAPFNYKPINYSPNPILQMLPEDGIKVAMAKIGSLQ